MMRVYLLVLFCFLGLSNEASAQPYNYTLEGFDDVVAFPAASMQTATVATTYISSTGLWTIFKGYPVIGSDPCLDDGVNRALRLPSGAAAYVVSPTLTQGVATITFNNKRTNKIFTYYTSLDNGATWSAGANITSPLTACGTMTITINSGVINRIKIANNQANDMGIDNLLITSFTINPPLVTTATVSAVTAVSSSCGGNVTADGGAPVTARGVCWNTAANPTIANSITNDGTGLGAFNSSLAGLLPSTTYHVRAYATNSSGTGYGGDSVFTTLPPLPTITVSPSSLSFGTVYQGSYSSEQTYTVSGIFLTPAAGNITITAPAGYIISTTSGAGYTSTLTIPYSGTTLSPTVIYIRFSPPTNGAFNTTILHSGGGAPSVNLIVTGIGSLLTSAGNLTNMGTDFWTGYGFHSRMVNNDATNGSWMSLYISAKQATTVRVSLPGIADPTFPRIVNIPANSSVEVTNFPQGNFGVNNDNPTNLPDARLYFTGTTPRGIHIESLSGVPVAVYEHTYGKDAAGAMLLFPTNTWGATYNVLSLGGKSNSGSPNSFFFVMASEDNTVIEITPSANIIDSSSNSLFNTSTTTNIKYPANTPFTITLNKGQVFNAMGELVNAVGADLTGSLVRSVNCDKKIAVWAGNGRTFVNTTGCSVSSGSDNMLQQMFPRVAWGTKYLTTPTKTMEYSIYKICVQDPTTRVWVNNPTHTTPLTGLVGAFYYQIENNTYNLIESDKPIMLIQYVVTGGCKNNTFGNNGNGDPEMIILSPVQQAINNVSVFSAGRMTISTNGASYINVVIKNGGIPSFRLDPTVNTTQMVDTGTSSYGTTSIYGSSTLIPIANAFKLHPNDPGYSYARFRVSSNLFHNLLSDTGFNAIAYGMAQGESYGFNAGTAIKNLSAIVQTINPFDSVSGTKTCRGNPVTLQIAVPYLSSQITSINWDVTTNSNISPNGSFPVFNPVPIRTYVQNDITYSVFTSPTPIVFNATGVFRLTATISGTFSSECGNSQVVPIDMVVIADTPRFKIVTTGCSSTLVTFTDSSGVYSGNNIVKWLWNFGDATTSTVQNPPQHNYPSIAVYNASLRIINNIGCFSDTSALIDLTGGIKAKFGVAPNDTICSTTTVFFSDTSLSSGAYGPITEWHWDFGEGAPVVAITNANQSHTYNTLGNYFVTLQVKTSNGCLSNIFKDTIVVNATPSVSVTASLNTCLKDSIQFTGNVTYPGTVSEFHWNFDDLSSGANNTSLIQNPKHLFSTSGLHNVKFYVVAPGGCSSNIYNLPVTIQPQPTAAFNYTSPACAKSAVTFTDLSTPNAGTITEWNWDFGDGATELHLNGNSFTHQYLTGGTYNIKLTVKTNNGCYDDSIKVITVNATPEVKFTLPGNLCLPNASATFTNNTTINDGTIATVTYLWDFGDPSSGALNVSALQNPIHIYNATGNYSVKLTTTSALGCAHDTTIVFNAIYPAPLAVFTPPVQVCMNDSIQFTDQSTPAGGISSWSWNFGDGGVAGTSALQNPKHRWNTAGPFTVILTVTSSFGCSSTSTAQSSQLITVNTAPTISLNTASATTTQSLCLGTAITNIEYNLGGSTTSATVTGLPAGVTGLYVAGVFTISGSPSSGGIYNYTVTSVSPCTNVSLGGTITVQTLPTINLSSAAGTDNQSVCVNTAIADITYTLGGNVNGAVLSAGSLPVGITGSFNAGVFTISGIPTSTGVFNYTVTSVSTCSNVSMNGTITINALPDANFTFSTIRCEGEDVTFTYTTTAGAAAISQWQWNFGDGTAVQTQLVQATINHTYVLPGNNTVQLSVTNINGCVSPVNTSPVVVTINPKPVSAFNFSDVCLPVDIATFTDLSTPVGNINLWEWDFGDASPIQTSTTAGNITHQYLNGGEYDVTLTTTSLDGCKKDTARKIKAFTPPNASFTINNTGNICSNVPLEITNTSTVSAYGNINQVEILWNIPGTNNTIDNTPTANEVYAHLYPLFGTPATQSYQVLIKASTGNSCMGQSIPQTITLYAAPDVIFNAISSVCEEALSVTLNSASDIYNNIGTGIYSGSGIATSPVLNPSTAGAGSHSILYTFTGNNGCMDTASQNIFIYPTPKIELGADRNVLEGDQLTLVPVLLSGSGLVYSWTPSTYLDNPLSATPITTPLNDISYLVDITSIDGCKSSDLVNIKVVRDFIVPNTFTPNGDGINDKWEIEFLSLYPNHHIQIFNRYGQVILDTKNYITPWDGTYKGKPLPAGTYYYIIDLDGLRATKKGYITIIK